MIRREDVADLRPGDVVELWRNTWPDGTVVRGPLWQFQRDWLYVAEMAVFSPTEGCALGVSYTLTVVSRASRPLYVNHDRAEPVPGDVVRDADDDSDMRTWQQDGYGQRGDAYRKSSWWSPITMDRCRRDDLPKRLRLLVDGETGQVVP